MARLGEALAGLWAAVWVRWELMRARRARRAAGRDLDGDDLLLPVMAVPVEGVDYEPVELDDDLRRRLEVTAADLIERAPRAAARPSSPGRGLRAFAATAGALLAVAVVGASAGALIAGSTGVPAVDKLLGIWESGLERDSVPERQGVGPSDVRPAEAGPTLSYGDGDGPAGQVTSFVGRSGQVCMVHTFEGRDVGTTGCESPNLLAGKLEKDGLSAFQLETTAGEVAIFGQVADDVDSVRVTGPVGPMDVRLGRRWDATAVVGGMRPFVAFASLTGAAAGDAGVRAMRDAQYLFEVERGGRTATISDALAR